MLPVEKMAARLLKRHNLTPPYNLSKLAKLYGDLEYRHFPIPGDGITIGIGVKDKPNILINESMPKTRQKFTLAHELGHIIIPWHTGTVISHENSSGRDNHEYLEMESEANRFAAELLIPSSWVSEEFENAKNFKQFIIKIFEAAEVSREALLIKVFNTLQKPLICVQVSESGHTVSGYYTKSAPNIDVHSSHPNDKKILGEAEKKGKFILSNREYRYWQFSYVAVDISEDDTRSWREILDQILVETDSVDSLGSINAILASHFQKHKTASIPEICGHIIRTFKERNNLTQVIEHRSFDQYIIKRVTELAARNK